MTGNGNDPFPGLKVPGLGSKPEPCARHPSGTSHPQPAGQPLPVNPAAAGAAAHQLEHARRPVHRRRRPAVQRELLGGAASAAQKPPAVTVLELKGVLRRVRRSWVPHQPHCGDAPIFVNITGQRHKPGPSLCQAKPAAGQNPKAHAFQVIPGPIVLGPGCPAPPRLPHTATLVRQQAGVSWAIVASRASRARWWYQAERAWWRRLQVSQYVAA
jgi:hypothetical protein